MEDLHPYRAPMVTATGIFLGFMLNFTSSWIKDAFAKNIFKDVVVAIGVTICLASLLTVLFRILRMHYPTEPDKFYRRTLLLFMIGITVPFFAFLIVIVQKIVVTVR
jgi:hypothetical protein